MKRLGWPLICAVFAALILLRVSLTWTGESVSSTLTLTQVLAFLFPIGFALVIWAAMPADRSDSVGSMALLALALALIGYWAIGFGLHFGGIASATDVEGLQHLSQYFSIVRGDESASWGILGLEGFFPGGDTLTPAALQLLLSQLPLAASVVLIVLLALPRETPFPPRLVCGIVVSVVTYPLAGNWASGGGWLANLGSSLALGHGLVDFSGTATMLIVGGATALAATLVFSRQTSRVDEGAAAPATSTPPAENFLLAALGAVLTLIGWTALNLANPLYEAIGDHLNWSLISLNALAGLAGGTLAAQLGSWFATGHLDPQAASRGALAGLFASSAGAAFVPLWAALVIGAAAGLLLPMATFAFRRLLHFEDVTSAISAYVIPAAWGMLGVALFADGHWGQGWNGVSELAGQGISGLLAGTGFRANSGQLAAQLCGVAMLSVLGFLLPWGIFRLLSATYGLQLSVRMRVAGRRYSPEHGSDPSSESRITSSHLDQIIKVDDR